MLVFSLATLAAPVSRGVNLIVDGDFDRFTKSVELRRDDKGQDWYESRKDTKEGRKLLILSKKPVGGNATAKAMIKAHPDLNTYLSQMLATPQTDDFTVQFDILVKEILPDDNRSAFFMIGNNSDRKGGPNSTGAERFVFMGFENAGEPGKINLFAREEKSGWDARTILAKDLSVNTWYTIEVIAYPSAATYEVTVKGPAGSVGPIEVDAFKAAGKAPKKLTHLSFASWNDGAGTFYIDNVMAHTE